MTNKVLIASLLIISFLSCKKETANPDEKPIGLTTEHYPTKAGSYFVYHWYSIDSNKVETPLSDVDTIYILGDTLLNGKTYTIYKESFRQSWFKGLAFRRDSAGYIVDQNGKVLYSYVNFNDTFGSETGNAPWVFHSKMINGQDKIQVPAGSFSAVERRMYCYNDQIIPLTACGDTVIVLGTYYAPALGEIKLETGYLQEIRWKCNRMERRLVTYHIP